MTLCRDVAFVQNVVGTATRSSVAKPNRGLIGRTDGQWTLRPSYEHTQAQHTHLVHSTQYIVHLYECRFQKRGYGNSILTGGRYGYPSYGPPLKLRSPLKGFPLELGTGARGQKLEWWGYRAEKKVWRYLHLPVYNAVECTNATDGRMDRRERANA